MIDLMYERDILMSLNRGQGPSTLEREFRERLHWLKISVTGRRQRGCRASRHCWVTNLHVV